MTKREKLLAGICNNPRSVRFDDACRAAELLGFKHKGGQGSHRAFARPGEPELLNFQDRNGCIVPYQARQLIRMIERYSDDKISD
ncbi:MAG: type II toxin-antitoxin system HicA family toxin [Nitrosomonadales bacterium]|nr:type II toxin-antitoxin system HicA family toxin [Nitrosomonadales bacterium]